MGITLGNIGVRGTVRKGFAAHHPEERVARIEFPGLDGGGEIMLGLGGRLIVVPMCVFPYTTSGLDALERSLIELRRGGQEFTAVIQTAIRTAVFPNCKLRAVEPRSDVIPDVAGTVGGQVFVHWEFILYQLKV